MKVKKELKEGPLVFEGQRENEDILWFSRQHPYVFALTGYLLIFVLLFSSFPLFIFGTTPIAIKFFLFFLVLVIVVMAVKIFIWWNTIYVLTNQRVIGIHQSRIFFRRVSEVPLENIQNISHTKEGMPQHLLNYGSVEIQTSGGKIALIIEQIPNPYSVEQQILEAQREIIKG